jgi:hypothetical protein
MDRAVSTMTRRISWSIPLLVGGIFGALSTLATIGDPDLFWHLAQGRQTLGEGLVRVDRFSWSVAGQPVMTDQWLGQVIWYAAYALAGWTGIILMRAVLVGAIVTLIVAAAHDAQRRPFVAVVAALPAIALTRYGWTERPQLIGLLCFTVLLVLLRAANDRPRVLLAVPPLILLWANLHASFALGLAITVIAGAELWLRRPELRRLLAGVVIASLAVTVLTPSGPGIWTSSGGHFLSPPRVIQEEGVPDVTQPYGVLFAFVMLAVLVTALLARPASLREAVLLVPVLFVSMTAARHTPFFAVASAPYLARYAPDAIGALARRLRVAARLPSFATSVPPRYVDVTTAVLAVALIVGSAAIARAEPNLDPYPAGALAALPAGPGVLNDYDWGGFLIWYAPATPVFVDGRLFPYVGSALDDYRAVIGLHPDWREVIARRGIRAVLVRPSDAIAVRASDLGWPTLARTPEWVLLRVP